MKIIVDISDAQVSNNLDDLITTYSLGSCIGVALYDPVSKVGGMLHYQLPSSKQEVSEKLRNPLMYADTGMEYLVNKMGGLGAAKKRLQIKIAGGAQMMNDASTFKIGKRNYTELRKILWKNGMLIDSEDIGGKNARNLSLEVDTGRVTIKSQGEIKEL